MIEQMTRHWGTLAVRGVLAVLFGILAFLAPGVFAATFALLVGIALIALAFRLRRHAPGSTPSGPTLPIAR